MYARCWLDQRVSAHECQFVCSPRLPGWSLRWRTGWRSRLLARLLSVFPRVLSDWGLIWMEACECAARRQFMQRHFQVCTARCEPLQSRGSTSGRVQWVCVWFGVIYDVLLSPRRLQDRAEHFAHMLRAVPVLLQARAHATDGSQQSVSPRATFTLTAWVSRHRNSYSTSTSIMTVTLDTQQRQHQQGTSANWCRLLYRTRKPPGPNAGLCVRSVGG